MQKKTRILMVDDDLMILRLLTKILGDLYACETAENAAEARQQLASSTYELMITDINMPGESGLDLIRFVKTAYPETGVVVVSGVSEPGEALQVLDAGVYGYLLKPFEAGQILITVENAIRRRMLENRFRADREYLEETVRDRTAALETTLTALKEEKEKSDSLAQSLQDQLFFIKTLMDAIPNPIFYKDREGVYQGCNQAFSQMTGVPAEKIVGRSVFALQSDQLAAVHHEVDMALVRNRDKITYEAKVTDGEGHMRDIIMNKAAFMNAEDQVAGIVGVVLDITERKAMEQRLKDSETRFRKLVEGSIQGVLIHQNMKPVFVNSAFAVIFGYTEDEIIHLPSILRFIAPCEQERLTGYIKERMEGHSAPTHYEFKGIRKEGTEIWLECRVLVVTWEGGPATQLTVSDITEKKRHEEALMQSELRLKTIWDAIQTGVAIIDEETQVIMDINPAAVEMIGLPREAIIGKGCNEFIWLKRNDVDPRPMIEESFDKKEAIIPRVEGKQIPIIKTVNRGTIDGRDILINSFVDISELKTAEAALEKSHREMAALVSGITSIFIGLSGALTIVQWNETAEKTFGVRALDVLGKSFWDAGISWDWEPILEAVASCREKGGLVPLNDFRFQRPDGKEGFLSIRLSAVRYEGGTTPGILVMGSEITERKLLESQLAQAQKLESIGQLAAGIAHEINTPIQYVGDNTRFFRDAFKDLLDMIHIYGQLLTAVKDGGPTDALVREIEDRAEAADLEYLSEEAPKAVEQTLDGVERISKIVRSMKEFSHPGVDEKTSVDINKSLESTVTVARNEWKYVAEMELDLDPNLSRVSCFPGELNQVFLNIIINAAHAIQSVTQARGDGQKGLIRITTRNLNDKVEVRIHDTGTGIPEKIRHRIFDPFFTTKEVGKGTGQGLAIAHRVVLEKHKGSLRFETKPGEGTIFIIELPVQ